MDLWWRQEEETSACRKKPGRFEAQKHLALSQECHFGDIGTDRCSVFSVKNKSIPSSKEVEAGGLSFARN